MIARTLRVRDRNGAVTSRAANALQEGDVVLGDGHVMAPGQTVQVPFMLTDGVRDGAALGHAERILGDGYKETDYRGLSDEAVRHAVVKKKLGAPAEGRSAAYLDAAWGVLAGTGTTPPAAPTPIPSMLTDEQRAVGREGVRQALASLSTPALGRGTPLTDAKRQAGQDRIRGAYAAMKSEMQDAWKPEARRDAEARSVTLDPRDEARFRDGRIADNPVNRARAEMARELSEGWKMGRR